MSLFGPDDTATTHNLLREIADHQKTIIAALYVIADEMHKTKAICTANGVACARDVDTRRTLKQLQELIEIYDTDRVFKRIDNVKASLPERPPPPPNDPGLFSGTPASLFRSGGGTA